MSEYISADLRWQVARDVGHRCGYCQTDERLTGISLSIEHIHPKSRGEESIRENLWLACRSCNEFKGSQTDGVDPETGEWASLYNPRTQQWDDHFTWDDTGETVRGVTPVGRATVAVLQLNRPLLVLARKRWVMNGWHPPSFD